MSVQQDPGGNDSTDHEPDYRFSLANERTFLAWVRTTLALIAGAVAVQAIPQFGFPGGQVALSALCASLAILLAVISYPQWRRAQHAMRRDAPMPWSPGPALLAVGVLAVALLGAALVVTAV